MQPSPAPPGSRSRASTAAKTFEQLVRHSSRASGSDISTCGPPACVPISSLRARPASMSPRGAATRSATSSRSAHGWISHAPAPLLSLHCRHRVRSSPTKPLLPPPSSNPTNHESALILDSKSAERRKIRLPRRWSALASSPRVREASSASSPASPSRRPHQELPFSLANRELPVLTVSRNRIIPMG